MTRQEILNEYLRTVRTQRFRPGAHDCGLFAAGWVVACTGQDYADQWRGNYRSMADAQAMLEANGFSDHVEYVASVLPEVAPSMAQTGDIAVVDGRALGIFASDRVFVLRPDGLGHVSRMQAIKGFSVCPA